MVGERNYDFVGTVYYTDMKNGLKAELKFYNKVIK